MIQITQALQSGRYEIARRLCLDVMAVGSTKDRNLLLRHFYTACIALSDQKGCERALGEMRPETPDEQLDVRLLYVETFRHFGGYEHYRNSSEGKQGYSYDEYHAMLQEKSAASLAAAKELAGSNDQKKRLADTLRRCGRGVEADAIAPPDSPETPPRSPERRGAGILHGLLRFPSGEPVRDALVTLGLQVAEPAPDPDRYRHIMEYNFQLACSPLGTRTARTDAEGRYCLEAVPAGCHEFLAVNLDPLEHEISLHFLAHKIEIAWEGSTTFDAVLEGWQSPPPREVADPLPMELVRCGVRYRRIAEDILKNPFLYTFDRQLLELSLPPDAPDDPESFLLLSSASLETPCPFQRTPDGLLYFADLPALTDRVFAAYQTSEPVAAEAETLDWTVQIDPDGRSAVIDTGVASVRIPYGVGEVAVPPILAVKGADGVWRGQGRLTLPPGITVARRETEIVENGPLRLKAQVRYTLSNRMEYRLHLTFQRGESAVLVHEISPDLPNAAFEFSLCEFLGGRGYLHWCHDRHGVHWSDLTPEDHLLCRLEETVPWWCPPEGFGCAMTPAGLDDQDFIGVFTIRRGEWIDRKFEQVAYGPGDDRRELDWPHPEMVGSTVSMVTAHTSAEDAYFRFGLFDGERHWGLLISTLEANDGYAKAISSVQHKNSSPRLQEFKNWHLDFQDTTARPMLLIDRETLPELRRRKETQEFSPIYARIAAMRPNGGGQHNPNASGGFRAIVDGDPVLAWTKKRELVDIAQPHSLSILLGRDYSDEYSPVGARPVAPWAEDFDLIVATGVFTPDEERLARAHLMLLGHMYLQTDFTNWKFNARNANFEADRADTVGTVGLCFPDNPDGKAFIDHAASRFALMLQIYCTPGSGRWYENVSCYYLQSIKCWCNLVIHLARHGHIDPTEVPKLKEFLGWAINVFTPPLPASREIMCNGVDADSYQGISKVRRIAPFGDHAHLGPWIPEHIAVMARYFRKSDPQFADKLRWAYHASGANGGYYENPMLFFSLADETDLTPPETPCVLKSRRLEGFGAAFRGNFNQEDEFFLLLKQGPGGYRYHRSEGSLLLCADGKPLIYDGGELGEAWRHTTLSFYDTHTMLAPGHVERFQSFDTVDFVQGVHPVALKPGEPDYLCNDCRYELIDVAIARYNEPRPADARSVCWVKDEYVVLHDELDLDPAIPTHWHLQAVADSETGTLEEGFRFQGRFGTDLQVLLPGQEQAKAKIEENRVVEPNLPLEKSFTMRRLQVDGASGIDHYTAVIRPLAAGKAELTAKLLQSSAKRAGVHVSGPGIDDDLFFAHKGVDYADENCTFVGRYANILRRPSSLAMVLHDGERLSAAGCTLISNGPAASLHITQGEIAIETLGTGQIEIRLPDGSHNITCSGDPQRLKLHVVPK